MCRCAERRAVIGRSVAALAKGDVKGAKVGDAARFVGRTMVEDGRALVASARMAAARASLRR